MWLQISARSHTGSVRAGNEDNLCIQGRILPEFKTENYVLADWSSMRKPLFLGIFDGMGGFEHGERASFLMAELAAKFWKKKGACPRERLLDICHRANLAVCDEMRGPEGCNMGTTASMLSIENGRFTLCNVGDSPIFLFRDGSLREISYEHTERATFERVTGKKADPKRKFRLTQNIGMFPEEILIEPYCTEGDIQCNDLFLLCSDGITDMVDVQKLEQILQEGKDPAAITKRLEDAALAAGGRDNATVICAKIVKKRPWLSCFVGGSVMGCF